MAATGNELVTLSQVRTKLKRKADTLDLTSKVSFSSTMIRVSVSDSHINLSNYPYAITGYMNSDLVYVVWEGSDIKFQGDVFQLDESNYRIMGRFKDSSNSVSDMQVDIDLEAGDVQFVSKRVSGVLTQFKYVYV